MERECVWVDVPHITLPPTPTSCSSLLRGRSIRVSYPGMCMPLCVCYAFNVVAVVFVLEVKREVQRRAGGSNSMEKNGQFEGRRKAVHGGGGGGGGAREAIRRVTESTWCVVGSRGRARAAVLHSAAHINHKHAVRIGGNGVDEVVGSKHTAKVLVVRCSGADTCEAGGVCCACFRVDDEDSF